MNKTRFFLIVMMILPWFSLPLLGRRTIKKYLPAATFVTLVNTLVHIIAKKKNWWRFYTSIHPKISGSVPFIIGPEFIAALWTLKYHYGKFLKFIIINGIGHFLIAFPGVKILKQLNIVSLVRFKPIHVALLFLLRGLSLYGFQFAIDSMKKKKNPLFRVFH
jgi:hypothetical protein